MHRAMAVATLLRDAVRSFFEDDVPRLAAALAFYALLSLAPLLIVAVAVAGAVFSQQQVQGEVLEFVAITVGPAGEEVAAAVFENAYDAYRPATGVWASVIGALLLLVGASGVFTQLNASVAKIWGTEESLGTGFLAAVRERLRGVVMVLVVGLMLVALVAATALLGNIEAYLDRATTLSAASLEVVGIVVHLIAVALYFALVYRTLPATTASWRDVWPGAVTAAPLFAAGNWALSTYLSRSAVSSAYGAAGFLVVFLLWLYFAASVFLFGAEVSSEYSRRRRGRSAGRDPAEG